MCLFRMRRVIVFRHINGPVCGVFEMISLMVYLSLLQHKVQQQQQQQQQQKQQQQ